MKTNLDYLNKLKEKKEMVDVFVDQFDDSYTGFIIEVDEHVLVLAKINSESENDGVTILFQKYITRVRWGGNELGANRKLIDMKSVNLSVTGIMFNDSFKIIESMGKKFGYVCLHVQELDSSICFIGEVEEMLENHVLLHEYGTRSSMDRKYTMLDVGDITMIEAGGKYEENLKKLFLKK
jgi:hypothetical protein